ncbi:Glutamine-dependent NAD(+) synthetase [Candidatus Hydrogenisulfobacillus filiaventi]|uniref:Glutamine-dependent NAD(+) synthetase n=1 Tax=Candidatus Hydrogenisulfobacillus filiaventi TaxID=2707344 RepID=A0A6F8ZEX0_9FIRM|nr:NAD+ synthase [Bacillota bacterium]CAB1128418.1 Glutamine-dependent NAD(+) synthetase [Candidatus Hydrogenisulfobacillus filiaventi]
MQDRVRVVLAQLNSLVGDVAGNLRRVREAVARAREWGADLVVFPEMMLGGYPAEDLWFHRGLVAEMRAAVEALAPESRDLLLVVGYARDAGALENAAAVLAGGRLAGTVAKRHLPNYGVFDEARYFRPGRGTTVWQWGPWRLGISICEDIWYPDGPYLDQVRAGADLLINISASPYHRGKGESRERMLATRAQDTAAWLLWCNLVGGQDELVFDGTSAVFAPDGRVVARAPAFAEDLVVYDLPAGPGRHQRWVDPRWRLGPPPEPGTVRHRRLPPPVPGTPRLPAPGIVHPRPGPEEELFGALVTGVRDYIAKNGFGDVVIGLSGGIDSSLTAVVAVEALGPRRVHGVLLPSPITSSASREDALAVAHNLGIPVLEIPLAAAMQAVGDTLAPIFAGLEPDVTEENIQARLRGLYLMALSNKFGWLVLTTGNKSEMATGYSTLYGDMAGGFAVLKDVLKTDVYRLAAWVNRQPPAPRIPERVLTKPPSAELRPGQKDEDSLPPYPVLDRILAGYVEEDREAADLVAEGLPEAEVVRAIELVNRNEYKRRQAPVGIKVTPRAFGRDRRMPITGRYPLVRPREEE